MPLVLKGNTKVLIPAFAGANVRVTIMGVARDGFMEP